MKVYKTFEEIDHDLKILRLQTKIEKEELKMGFSEIKEDLSPISVAGNFIGSLTKKALIFKTVASLIGLGKRK